MGLGTQNIPASKEIRAPTTSGKIGLPQTIFRYVLRISGWHQPVLVVLTVAIFLLEVVPLELQRRIVNDLVKERNYHLVVMLCAVYAGIVIVQGGIKLVLNVYRGWLGECAVRDLRHRIRALAGAPLAKHSALETNGIEISMIVAEVEPIGGFVGGSISEPLLQGGVLLSTVAYMIHVEPWMALTALLLFTPQLVFVPLLQRAINRRTMARIRMLREVSAGILAPGGQLDGGSSDDARIDHIFAVDMGIFRFRFTLHFLMNLCNHIQIVAILLLGGWYVHTDQLAIGGVVAFISAVGRLKDPWSELIDYFRDLSATQVKFRLMTDIIGQLEKGKER